MGKIKIGVSSCLLGNEVRYDGQHKFNWYINNILSNYFEYVAVCPEIEVGMGIPRPTIRLEGDVKSPRIVEPKSKEDWTDRMLELSRDRMKSLTGISGFIFKKGSPSCGVFKVKVYDGNHITKPLPTKVGRFAHY